MKQRGSIDSPEGQDPIILRHPDPSMSDFSSTVTEKIRTALQTFTDFISVNVTPAVREARKHLRAKLPEISKEHNVKYAYIPRSVPACTIDVKKDGSRQRPLNEITQ